jgi:tetratricopeptide (TPR) repeat protein
MKSERRHELEQNMLADWLGETIAKIKPYSSTILLAVLVVVLGLVVAQWFVGHSFATWSGAWDAYFAAFDDPNASEEFDKVAETYPRSEVADWATVTAADIRLQYGCNQLFTNRTMANQELTKAVNGYLKILEQARHPALRERATFGLARAKEAQGDLDDALKSYTEVVKQWPKGAFEQAAQHRADDLGRKSTKQFYDNFAKANPKPMPAEGAASGTGPEFNEKAIPEGPAPKSSGTESSSSPSPETSKPADAKK